jgi:predicted RNase H-like nuclease (RuvC/YqgF family)
MIPTKTYPLSAIMGKEIEEEYERGYAQGCEEGKERISELEAELTMRRKQAEGLQNQWVKDTQKIVALEAEVMEFRSRGNVAMSSWDEERERALREGERVVALEADVKDLHADIARLTTEAYTRDAECKTLRVDAERYRWLRDKHDDGDEQWFVYGEKSDRDRTLDDDSDAEREGK